MNYYLIVAIIKKGFSDTAMAYAKRAGANGGTCVSARGLGKDEAVKFLGITVDPEKDMLMVASDEEHKDAIVDALYEHCGMDTKGNGIVLVLPIAEIKGGSFGK